MMNSEIELVDQPSRVLSMHPKKFALWLFIVTVVMIFASLTSAYIVRQAEGDWLAYELPDILWFNSGIILLSSFTMHWAYNAAKKDYLDQLKIAISITSVLGLVFLIGQFLSWGYLVENNVYFVGNPAGSFMYVLTGLHGVHLISGVIFLWVVLTATFRYRVHAKNLDKIEMCATYWHFLDGLWLYLFIFLLLNH